MPDKLGRDTLHQPTDTGMQEASARRKVEFRGSTNRRVTSYSPVLENMAPWLLQTLSGEQSLQHEL